MKNKKQNIMKSQVWHLSQNDDYTLNGVEIFNDLTGIFQWVRSGVGRYSVLNTQSGQDPYTEDKTHIAPFGNWTGNGNPYLPLSTGDAILGYFTIYWVTPDQIWIEVEDANFQPADLYDLIGNTKLYLPKIEVYP